LSIADNDLRLHCYDHSGAIFSSAFNIHREPFKLIRVITSLAFADRYRLGFDPTIHISFPADTQGASNSTLAGLAQDDIGPNAKPKGPIGRVIGSTASAIYNIVSKIWSSDAFIGRGTVVYHVKSTDGKAYVLKDCWVNKKDVEHESMILEKAKGIPGVPKLVDAWNVTFNGEVDCTSRIRHGLGKVLPKSFITRVHRRLLMTPLGLPITTFRSQRELLSCFRDIV
ncbi:hypothetical protein BV22DRAFT_994777, partial [Leucogyrophana mollusca]